MHIAESMIHPQPLVYTLRLKNKLRLYYLALISILEIFRFILKPVGLQLLNLPFPNHPVHFVSSRGYGAAE